MAKIFIKYTFFCYFSNSVVYDYTDSNGCSNSASADITIIEPAAIAAGPDKSFCISEADINLSLDAAPNGGTWSGAGVSGSMFSPQDAGVGLHEIVFNFDRRAAKLPWRPHGGPNFKT